jgi:repressor LexA
MDGLTQRQKQVLRGIHEIAQELGYPPTVREIGQRLGLSSSCTVQRHLDALERKGFIRRNRTKARSVEIVRSDDPMLLPPRSTRVPLLGTVTAGEPILAVQNIEEVYSLPTDLVPKSGEAFMLRVKGDSMIRAGLFDGDLVLVRRQETADEGDVVVALIGEEATIKRFYRQNGKIRLQPENPTMDPIIVDDAAIIGKVMLGIHRFA